MSTISIVLLYGIPLSLALSAIVLITIYKKPRLMLRDYPADIQNVVPPQTPTEKRQTGYLGVLLVLLMLIFSAAAAFSAKGAHHGFLSIFLSAFGAPFLFNIVDWLILDWLIFCTITPKFAVFPGTEGMAGYKNYAMHLRGFLIGMLLSAVVGLIVAGIITFV